MLHALNCGKNQALSLSLKVEGWQWGSWRTHQLAVGQLEDHVNRPGQWLRRKIFSLITGKMESNDSGNKKWE